MRKEATHEQWKELYDIAIKIKGLKPWEHLCDIDIITLMFPDRELIYNSVMGKGGGCYGIGSYISHKAINNLYNMLDKRDFPIEQIMRFHEDDLIVCYYGSRDELTTKEWKLIKELGYKFRGKNNWIYFHSFEKGYVPYMLNQEEVLLETEILQNLYMALKAYIIEGLKVDFKKGNSLIRMWDDEDELWLNFEAPLMRPEIEYVAPTIEDEILKSRIDDMDTTKQIWELDIAYAGGVIRDKKYKKPASMRICILAETKSGIIMDQKVLAPDYDEIQIIINMAVNQMFNFGKPSEILVRDESMYFILEDLCNIAKIKLEIREHLKAIDSFLREFADERFM